VALYNCKLVDKGPKWVDHDILRKYEGKLMRDSMPDFWIDDIKDIFVLSEKLREKFSLEDALQLYIDPHFRPLSGVECNWNTTTKHSPDCDARLHESLYVLATSAQSSWRSSEANIREEEEKINRSLHYIRRRLLTTGARIP